MSTNETSSKKPSHRLYVITGENDSAVWKDIGAAWANKDGNGYSIMLDALPIKGRIVLRKITAKPSADADQGALV